LRLRPVAHALVLSILVCLNPQWTQRDHHHHHHHRHHRHHLQHLHQPDHPDHPDQQNQHRHHYHHHHQHHRCTAIFINLAVPMTYDYDYFFVLFSHSDQSMRVHHAGSTRHHDDDDADSSNSQNMCVNCYLFILYILYYLFVVVVVENIQPESLSFYYLSLCKQFVYR